MHLHCTRMWESVVCAYTAILSGHTEFLVQALLISYSTTQIGIQALQMYVYILTTKVLFLLANHYF